MLCYNFRQVVLFVLINCCMLNLFSIIFIVVGYNINTDNPIVFRHLNSTHFGYSVILRRPWVIVGAPTGIYPSPIRRGKYATESGSAYKCNLNTRRCRDMKPGQYQDETGYIDQVNYYNLIKKENGWFGAAMALDDDSDILTICAPRTIITIFNTFDKHYSMHGVCYSGNVTSDNLQVEDKNLKAHDFLSTYWYNPMHGFSVHYASSPPSSLMSSAIDTRKNDSGQYKMIIGAPKHEISGSVLIKGQKGSVILPISDDSTLFGYSVYSGRFFNKNQLLFVAGAPGWSLVGQVAILDASSDPAKILLTLNGETVGEYFGSSITAGDLNNDGFDELIVGAPHWGNDEGRVYIYFGGSDDNFDSPPIIYNGPKNDISFGYSLACGDLDVDGFDDLIVGAPWEDNGAIYIYNGDIKAHLESGSKYQRIQGMSITETFGFTLSKPVDIDNNGFPDIAVGAYKSNRVVIMKSRPVVKTNFTIFITNPLSLQQNSTNFTVNTCIEHRKQGIPTSESFNLTLAVDDRFERVNESQKLLQYISRGTGDSNTTVCFNSTFYLLLNIQNFIDPIEITATHQFHTITIQQNKRAVKCTLCAIEVKGVEFVTKQLFLPFNIGCGHDQVCTSLITLSAQFSGKLNKNHSLSYWTLGSEDPISFDIRIRNDGEPAYSTIIIIELPPRIGLNSLLDFCHENENDENLKVTCNVGNPLAAEYSKTISLDLDMSQLNDGAFGGSSIITNVSVHTQSRNNGANYTSLNLSLLNEMYFILNGTANERNYYYSMDDQSASTIIFRHNYKIEKIGVTPVKEARITVRVPVNLGPLNTVTLTNEPRIYISGKLHKCSVTGIPTARKSVNYTPTILKEDEEEDSAEESYHFNMKRNKSRTKRQSENVDYMQPSSPLDKFDITSEKLTIENRAIYLNCSSPHVRCGKITCNIGPLNSKRDIGELQLRLSVDPKSLWNHQDLKSSEKIIFTSEAWIDVLKPVVDVSVIGTVDVTNVTTTFYSVRMSKRINVWIIVGSVLCGLFALFFIAVGLRMLNFFKRSKKDELVALKNEEENISEN